MSSTGKQSTSSPSNRNRYVVSPLEKHIYNMMMINDDNNDQPDILDHMGDQLCSIMRLGDPDGEHLHVASESIDGMSRSFGDETQTSASNPDIRNENSDHVDDGRNNSTGYEKKNGADLPRAGLNIKNNALGSQSFSESSSYTDQSASSTSLNSPDSNLSNKGSHRNRAIINTPIVRPIARLASNSSTSGRIVQFVNCSSGSSNSSSSNSSNNSPDGNHSPHTCSTTKKKQKGVSGLKLLSTTKMPTAQSTKLDAQDVAHYGTKDTSWENDVDKREYPVITKSGEKVERIPPQPSNHTYTTAYSSESCKTGIANNNTMGTKSTFGNDYKQNDSTKQRALLTPNEIDQILQRSIAVLQEHDKLMRKQHLQKKIEERADYYITVKGGGSKNNNISSLTAQPKNLLSSSIPTNSSTFNAINKVSHSIRKSCGTGSEGDDTNRIIGQANSSSTVAASDKMETETKMSRSSSNETKYPSKPTAVDETNLNNTRNAVDNEESIVHESLVNINTEKDATKTKEHEKVKLRNPSKSAPMTRSSVGVHQSIRNIRLSHGQVMSQQNLSNMPYSKCNTTSNTSKELQNQIRQRNRALLSLQRAIPFGSNEPKHHVQQTSSVDAILESIAVGPSPPMYCIDASGTKQSGELSGEYCNVSSGEYKLAETGTDTQPPLGNTEEMQIPNPNNTLQSSTTQDSSSSYDTSILRIHEKLVELRSTTDCIQHELNDSLFSSKLNHFTTDEESAKKAVTLLDEVVNDLKCIKICLHEQEPTNIQANLGLKEPRVFEEMYDFVLALKNQMALVATSLLQQRQQKLCDTIDGNQNLTFPALSLDQGDGESRYSNESILPEHPPLGDASSKQINVILIHHFERATEKLQKSLSCIEQMNGTSDDRLEVVSSSNTAEMSRDSKSTQGKIVAKQQEQVQDLITCAVASLEKDILSITPKAKQFNFSNRMTSKENDQQHEGQRTSKTQMIQKSKEIHISYEFLRSELSLRVADFGAIKNKINKQSAKLYETITDLSSWKATVDEKKRNEFDTKLVEWNSIYNELRFSDVSVLHDGLTKVNKAIEESDNPADLVANLLSVWDTHVESVKLNIRQQLQDIRNGKSLLQQILKDSTDVRNSIQEKISLRMDEIEVLLSEVSGQWSKVLEVENYLKILLQKKEEEQCLIDLGLKIKSEQDKMLESIQIDFDKMKEKINEKETELRKFVNDLIILKDIRNVAQGVIEMKIEAFIDKIEKVEQKFVMLQEYDIPKLLLKERENVLKNLHIRIDEIEQQKQFELLVVHSEETTISFEVLEIDPQNDTPASEIVVDEEKLSINEVAGEGQLSVTNIDELHFPAEANDTANEHTSRHCLTKAEECNTPQNVVTSVKVDGTYSIPFDEDERNRSVICTESTAERNPNRCIDDSSTREIAKNALNERNPPIDPPEVLELDYSQKSERMNDEHAIDGVRSKENDLDEIIVKANIATYSEIESCKLDLSNKEQKDYRTCDASCSRDVGETREEAPFDETKAPGHPSQNIFATSEDEALSIEKIPFFSRLTSDLDASKNYKNVAESRRRKVQTMKFKPPVIGRKGENTNEETFAVSSPEKIDRTSRRAISDFLSHSISTVSSLSSSSAMSFDDDNEKILF